MRSKIFFIALVLSLASLVGAVPLAQAVSVYPEFTDGSGSPGDVFAPGDNFYLVIKVDDAVNVAGAALTVEYDATVFEVDEADAGGYFIPEEEGMFPTVYDNNTQPAEQAEPRVGKDDSNLGRVLLSGAYVDIDTGGGHYTGEQILFSLRFRVKDDASPGSSYDFVLVQTRLTNIDAGWDDELVPVLVGAVDKDHQDFGGSDLSDDFPVLLGDDTNPFSEVAGTVEIRPWSPVTGMPNEMIVHGTASGDWIGAFGPGGDCRGVSRIGGDGSYNLTVAGDADGEEISFKIFRNGQEVDVPQTVVFDADGAVELDFDITQDVVLIAGWNWVSFNVLPEDFSLDAVFGGDADLVEQVKTQTMSATNVSGLGWLGNVDLLSNISEGAMFKIKTTSGFTLSLTGAPVEPDLPIPCVEGWTWIAYLPDSCDAVETCVTSVFDDLYQIKSQTQSKTKIGDNLIGDLLEMCPKLGYKIRMEAADSLVYPNP